MTQAPRRLGVYGGAFDPPHQAHVALAAAAVRQLALDEIRVLPTGEAWHRAGTLTDARHRLAMTRLAFAGIEHAAVDDREIRRSGPTYTADTLSELHQELPDAELFLVMGEDQARAFPGWHAVQGIVRMATLCVAGRVADNPVGNAPGNWRASLPAQARVVEIELPQMPHSATEVRERLARGDRVDELVPAPVARYIEQHHLYQTA